MKLAAALAQRRQLNEDIQTAWASISSNIWILEGLEPKIDVNEGMEEVVAKQRQILGLNAAIVEANNRPNTVLDEFSIVEALSCKAGLDSMITYYQALVRTSNPSRPSYGTNPAMTYYTTLDHELCAEQLKWNQTRRRELDLAIQEADWTIAIDETLLANG